MNHREIEGTIKKTKSQEWYIALAVEKEDKPLSRHGFGHKQICSSARWLNHSK